MRSRFNSPRARSAVHVQLHLNNKVKNSVGLMRHILDIESRNYYCISYLLCGINRIGCSKKQKSDSSGLLSSPPHSGRARSSLLNVNTSLSLFRESRDRWQPKRFVTMCSLSLSTTSNCLISSRNWRVFWFYDLRFAYHFSTQKF